MAEVAEPDIEKVATQVYDLLAHGATLKQIHGYTDDEMEAVYTLGFNYYNQGKFEEAMRLFGFLLMHDQMERRYYKAFGSCQHMLKKYTEAIRNYSMASLFDLSDPEPTFHTAECMIALGMKQEAKEALDLVVRQTAKRPEYAAMNERSAAMLKILDGGGK